MTEQRIDKSKLWYWVQHGSLLTKAMALLLLDDELDGEISRIAKEWQCKR